MDVNVPARLTRAEAQARTRRRLMESGTRVFAARGFAGATVEEIAERAGFTRGAFYANFADKADLFLTILERQADEAMRAMADAVGSAAGSDKLDAILQWFDRVILDRRLESAFGEFQSVATRDRRSRERMANRYRSILDAVASAIEDYCTGAGVTLPIPARDLATMVVPLVEGFGVARRLDPKGIPSTRLGEALTYLWFGVLSAGGQSTVA